LVVCSFGLAQSATFQGSVINPLPRGRIETTGRFGPWNADNPELTPITGDYVFKDANLDGIRGLGGTLSSVGTYRGILERIDVEGQTETPDFSIDLAGQPVPLTTRFKAVVDGTNGDTWLERVDARVAESTIIAKGAVVRTADVKGRRVSLELEVVQARLEDLLKLAMKSATPPLVGRVDVSATFLLPAGTASVMDRLQLNGRFKLAQARFSSINVQRRINVLSRRGRGDEDSTGEGNSVVSNLRGQFALRNGRLSFSELTFAVPGTAIQLTGVYDLRADTVDFVGEALFDSSLAQMTSGFKSVLAHLAQPFFRRPGGGSRLPIRISGPRTQPSFGLDMRRVLRRG